ncbi:Serine/threonine-protein kinase HipA [compost metagenome]
MTDAKNTNVLQIYKDGVFAGALERTAEGCSLVFDQDFRESSKGKGLTYCIPLTQSRMEYRGVGLPAYFAGLLPEGLRLKALVRRLKTSEDDMFSLLVAAGMDPVGDIHFKDPEESDKDEEETELELPKNFSALRDRLKEGETLGGSSLAGVQEKASADRISLPLLGKKRNKSYILKLESKEFPEGIANEYACLKLAKACGLQVNEATIVHDENGEAALLVERFDREWDKKRKQWHRLHQEDACQFLNLYPADKYRVSLQKIAEGVAQFSSTPEIEILSLLKLVAFSYLVGNGDLHAKNISLIEKNGITQMSPAYDILCTGINGDHTMALLFDGKNQNLKRKTFIEFGERYNVPGEATASMLKSLTTKFQKHKDLIFSFPLAIEKKAFLTQMFNERLGHLS